MPTIDTQISLISDSIAGLHGDITDEQVRALAANNAILSSLTTTQENVEAALYAMQEPYLQAGDLTALDADMNAIDAAIDPLNDAIDLETGLQSASDTSIDQTILILSGHVTTLAAMADPFVSMDQKNEIDTCTTNLQAAIDANTTRKTVITNNIVSQKTVIAAIQGDLSTMLALQPLSTAE